MNNLESDVDEDNETVIPETQMNNSDSDYNNQNMLDEGYMICKHDDNHDKLQLCEGCNGEYHKYCLHPPLHLVPEYDFFCEKCKEAGKDDGMLELIKIIPSNYSDRFGDIVWVDGGQGYGYWPVVVLNEMETSGNLRAQYRKMLGKQFIVGLFECSSCKYLLFLQESHLVNWNEGKLSGFCDRIMAKEKAMCNLIFSKKH
jgi:hypothetical protein